MNLLMTRGKGGQRWRRSCEPSSRSGKLRAKVPAAQQGQGLISQAWFGKRTFCKEVLGANDQLQQHEAIAFHC
jgi:hypothetical protein